MVALGIGIVVILAAWVPISIARRPVSLPVVLVLLGALLFAVPGFDPGDPREHLKLTYHLTEVGVLAALLGAGLSINRPVGWHGWKTTWRLLTIGMLLCIGAIALLGWLVMGLSAPVALLLGAILAPTDPVLASDVKVAEPLLDEDRLDEEDEVRFALTSEAGMNDGLAFPFVLAAIAASQVGDASWVAEWLGIDLAYRIGIGIAIGWFFGRALARMMFDPPGRLPPLASSAQGFVALGATMVVYASTELVHGYGFLAVFVTALSLRSKNRTEEYHAVLHQFTAEIEQLVSSVLLVLFGGAVVSGLLRGLDWRGVAVACAAVFVIRPLTAGLSLIGTDILRPERRAIAFFGIRGVGSVFYLTYAATHGETGLVDKLWAVVCFAILLSIVVHGVTATGTMSRLDRLRHRKQRRSISITAPSQ